MKSVALLLIGLSLGGCFGTIAEKKAYNACLDTVPEDINRAAEGGIDVYQTETPLALTKDNRLTSIHTLGRQPQCSPACQAAREEKHRIASECFLQWQKVHPSSVSDTEEMPQKSK